MTWHTKQAEEVIKELNTSKEGLTSNEAKLRLRKYGKNFLKKTKKLNFLKIALEQIKSVLIYVLIFAAIFSFVIGHFIDAIVIIIIVLVNAFIGFFQQYKAEKAIISLRKLLVPKAQVIRGGKHTEISSTFLVPGDILVLEAGDKVSADARVIHSNNLQANEAVLTGESLPIPKTAGTVSSKTLLAERTNMLYAGTQVVRGSAKAVVVETGMNSEFGKIATSLQEIETQKTPIQKRLDVFSKHLSFIIFGLVVVIVILGILASMNLIEVLLVGITLAVGAIPEGLPAVLAIAFSLSSKHMAQRNVIVRKLPAVESLGSVTVICTDKTGTLTEEQMDVQELYMHNKIYTKNQNFISFNKKHINLERNKDMALLLKTSVLSNNARYEIEKNEYKFIGDPTEEALVRMGIDLKLYKKQLAKIEPRVKEFEFDSKRKMMSVLRKTAQNNFALYSKGAAESILSNCSHEIVSNKKIKLSTKRKKKLLEEVNKLEEKALRVLAFAHKEFEKESKVKESDLTFLGFIGMLDPPRKEVKGAIKECKDAGIKVKIITGDSLVTAKAIAEKIGITGKAISGKELEQMSEKALLESVDDIVIFARTTPQQKLEITKALQSKSEVVAVTGDGINDVLALKSADIGIAMGKRGTDVARDVSDVVLIDDNFASIVEGVKQGRKTYDNIKKFTKYMLSVNLSEIFIILVAMVLAFVLGPEWILPLLPLQILWANLVTDSLPAISLVAEKGGSVMNSKPRKEKSIFSGIGKFILAGGILTFLGTFFVYYLGVQNNYSHDVIRTMALTTLIIFELTFVYVCRSKRSLFKTGVFSNKWLNYSVLLGLVLHAILLYTPLGILFGVVPLSLNQWLTLLPFGISGLVLFELFKLVKKKFFS